MNPGSRLRDFLASANRPRAQVAKGLGCTRAHLYHLMSGYRTPGLRLALAIERLTADWQHGPIRAAEWDATPEPTSEPESEAA